MRYEIFSNSNTPFKINSIGFSGDVNVTNYGPIQRNLYIVHYVIKGKGYFNGILVKEGQGFLIYPLMMEEYYPDKNDPWEYLWIISSDDKMLDIFKKYNVNPQTLIFNYNSISIVKSIANEIILRNNTIIDSLELLEYYLKIVNSHIYPKSNLEKSHAEIYIEFCLNYIESHIHEKISINKLTTILGVSQPYLFKIFNKKYNISLKQYIIDRKLNIAKKMLNKTDMSITQIANSLGYNDPLAFSKLFSLNIGVSPRKYKTNSIEKK